MLAFDCKAAYDTMDRNEPCEVNPVRDHHERGVQSKVRVSRHQSRSNLAEV